MVNQCTHQIGEAELRETAIKHWIQKFITGFYGLPPMIRWITQGDRRYTVLHPAAD